MKRLILFSLFLVGCGSKSTTTPPVPPVSYIATLSVYVASLSAYYTYSFYSVKLATTQAEFEQNIDLVWNDVRLRQTSLEKCVLLSLIDTLYPNYNLDTNVRERMDLLSANVSVTPFYSEGQMYVIVNVRQETGLYSWELYSLSCLP